jgi:hypothetical protein
MIDTPKRDMDEPVNLPDDPEAVFKQLLGVPPEPEPECEPDEMGDDSGEGAWSD